MELSFRNEQKIEQKQSLSLTPEMVQSLNILRFSGGELLDYISEAIEENPVMDIDIDYVESSHPSVSEEGGVDQEEQSDFGEISVPDEDFFDAAFSQSDSDEWEPMDWYEYSENASVEYDSYYGKLTYDSEYRDHYDYESAGGEGVSLPEHLEYQLELLDAPFMTKAIANYIILSLDDNGYMKTPLEDVASELNITLREVEEGLRIVQSFEPAGVGARTLPECMKLQMKAIGRLDSIYVKIIDNHLEDIAFNRLAPIAKATGLSVLDVQDRADIIRSLEPKPGRAYTDSSEVKYIIPDVKVFLQDGEYHAVINRVASPKIIIRSEYRDMLKDSDRGSAVADFLTARFNNARWLIKAIDQRNDTILKVTRAIIKRQKAFFEEGRAGLMPLTMKDVAQMTGVHESTVSRAVNGKYLQCPQGVFELRFFFTGAAGTFGDATSEYMKQMIGNLVAAEDQRNPMSDRAIAEAVMVMGIEISRRTVTKYREEMGIPSSSVRKRR